MGKLKGCVFTKRKVNINLILLVTLAPVITVSTYIKLNIRLHFQKSLILWRSGCFCQKFSYSPKTFVRWYHKNLSKLLVTHFANLRNVERGNVNGIGARGRGRSQLANCDHHGGNGSIWKNDLNATHNFRTDEERDTSVHHQSGPGLSRSPLPSEYWYTGCRQV